MTTPSQAPAAPPGGGAHSLVSAVGGPRNAAIIGAGITVVAVALITMKRGGSADTVTTMTGDTAFDSGPYDMWNQWQQEYEQLQNEINNGGGSTTATGPGTPKPPVPPPVQKPPAPPRAPWPPPPKVKPKPPTRTPTHKTVTVQHGDTLSGIAAKYHISMATLKKLNPTYWTNPKYRSGNLIWAGDKVKVS